MRTTRTGIDPVCGMTVDLDHAKGGTTVYRGREYGFCSPSCKTRFEGSPEKYLRPGKEEHSPAPTGTKWVCPMDPEIESDQPGPCPKCGMALDPASPAPLTRTEWTCPMHPEIVRDAPGSCPICGMALEPRTVMLAERNAGLDDLSRRFWVSLLFTVPVFLLGMSDLLPGMPAQHALGNWLPWVEFVLSTPVVLWAGWPLLQRGWASVVNRS